MAYPHAFLLIATLASLLLVSSFAQPAPAPAPAPAPSSSSSLVETSCGKTRNYSICVEILNSDPLTSSAKDLLGLAKIALDLAITNSTNIHTYADDLVKKGGAAVETYKLCAFYLESAVSSFKSALGELEEDLESANYDSKVASDGGGICEGILKSDGVKNPSVSAGNAFVILFSDITNAIITDMEEL